MARCQENSDCDCGFVTLDYLRKHKSQSQLMSLVVSIRDSTATPEMVLNFLSSPYYPATAYGREDTEPAIIFLECMHFIMTRSPEACIEGIREDIFKKTMSYSTKLFSSMYYWNRDRVWIYINTWLDEALSSPRKCPNPYVRLELFRLYRLVGYICDRTKPWEKITATFIETICEIKPHRLCLIIANEINNFKSLDDFIISSKDHSFLFTAYRSLEYYPL